MFTKLTFWVRDRASSKAAPWWLGVLSAAESIFFPVMPDVLMIPMILARPDRWIFFTLLTIVTSVVGGLVGYLVGVMLMDTVGAWLINLYGLQGAFDQSTGLINKWGALAVIVAAVSPIPYKIVTLTAGAAGMSVWVFVLASVVGRTLRFLVVGVAVAYLGPPAIQYFDRNRKRLVIASLVACAVVVVASGIAVSFFQK